MMHGIDVSHWQKRIDWAKVAKTQDFAYIRCAYGCKEDRRIKENWAASEGLLKRGVYQYYRADQDIVEQADFALQYGDGAELPMVLDVESDEFFDAADPKKMASDVEAWVKRIATWRGMPFIYTNLSWLRLKNHVDGWIYEECKLWVADVNGRQLPVSIPHWPKPTIWQYSWTGRIDGISTDVDMNHWIA